METVTITDPYKKKNDLTKLHDAISIMFHQLEETLPSNMKNMYKY